MFPNGYNHYSGGIKDFSYNMEEDIKQKISNSTKGKIVTEETKQRISKAQKNHPQKSKEVYQYTLDWELVSKYPSAQEAARQTGYNQGNISNCCNGGYYYKGKWKNRIQYNGYKWSYVPL